jgi:hypothetical protein
MFLGRCLVQYEDSMVEDDSHVKVLESSCAADGYDRVVGLLENLGRQPEAIGLHQLQPLAGRSVVPGCDDGFQFQPP